MPRSNMPVDFECYPVTPDRWGDLEKLFGKNGACGGCWCMYWRLARSEYDQKRGTGTKRMLKGIVSSGQVPGILAYADSMPIGWCSVGPRKEFSTLDRSRLFKPVDDKPAWSVVCFYVARPYRRLGVTVKLLKAALKYAREQGAKIVEGYPVEPKQDKLPDVFAYTGLASAFRQVGFKEVLRRSETRPMVRYVIK